MSDDCAQYVDRINCSGDDKYDRIHHGIFAGDDNNVYLRKDCEMKLFHYNVERRSNSWFTKCLMWIFPTHEAMRPTQGHSAGRVEMCVESGWFSTDLKQIVFYTEYWDEPIYDYGFAADMAQEVTDGTPLWAIRDLIRAENELDVL